MQTLLTPVQAPGIASGGAIWNVVRQIIERQFSFYKRIQTRTLICQNALTRTETLRVR
jgi:hypothetical protein